MNIDFANGEIKLWGFRRKLKLDEKGVYYRIFGIKKYIKEIE